MPSRSSRATPWHRRVRRSRLPSTAPLTIRLESKDGALLGQASFNGITNDWRKFSSAIRATATDPDARLVIGTTGSGAVALDMISLFPQKTFKNRPNGLRADLAQTIAELKPKFVRFPGGCLAHGDGIDNIYHWKNTIGPVERRKAQPNIWRYHQTTGLGYFEYFQFSEDIGAKPLPVVAAGVSCQNSNHQPGTGQQCIPLANMDEYIQDVLDLVEYANGPVTSTWGAKRAAAGHPKPFNLQYLGVGNEDHITPEFKERFAMIYRAVKAKYPKLDGHRHERPGACGAGLRRGVEGRRRAQGGHGGRALLLGAGVVPLQPEPLRHLRPQEVEGLPGRVCFARQHALQRAVWKAAYMAAMERNGDVVHLASYAPLIAHTRHINWAPNLIYFDNAAVTPTVNDDGSSCIATIPAIPTCPTPSPSRPR